MLCPNFVENSLSSLQNEKFHDFHIPSVRNKFGWISSFCIFFHYPLGMVSTNFVLTEHVNSGYIGNENCIKIVWTAFVQPIHHCCCGWVFFHNSRKLSYFELNRQWSCYFLSLQKKSQGNWTSWTRKSHFKYRAIFFMINFVKLGNEKLKSDHAHRMMW